MKLMLNGTTKLKLLLIIIALYYDSIVVCIVAQTKIQYSFS